MAIMLMSLHVILGASSAWAREHVKTSPSARKHASHKGYKAHAVKGKRHVRAARAIPRASPARRAKARTVRRKKAVSNPAAFAAAPKDARQQSPHSGRLDLLSSAVLVWDPATARILFEKNSSTVQPIASISKLMTALVVVEAHLDMHEVLEVTADDIDRIKHTSSRLRIGSRLTRADMLHIALMSSENRAASALGRNYPGGLAVFVRAMNAKAKELGMNDTHYVEPTGLSSENVSSARDLAKLVMAAQKHPVIREYSTNREYEVEPGGPSLQYRNSNRLIANPGWEIVLQKTGYISEAGRCLVMQTMIQGRAIVMVFLDAKGKYGRAADAGRVRKWLESFRAPQM